MGHALHVSTRPPFSLCAFLLYQVSGLSFLHLASKGLRQACFLVGGQETQGEKTQVPKLNKKRKHSRKFSKNPHQIGTMIQIFLKTQAKWGKNSIYRRICSIN